MNPAGSRFSRCRQQGVATPVFVVTSWSALLDMSASVIMMSVNASLLLLVINPDLPAILRSRGSHGIICSLL
jgi:hypothetical protein